MQTNKEIERKWLINEFPTNLKLLREHNMEQAYISTNPEVRIRRQECKSSPTVHFLTIKSNGGMVRDEVEVRISKAQYETLLQMANATPIVKEHKVYETPTGEELECSKVDPGTENEFFYCEIEFKDEQTAKAFKDLNIFVRDITEDPKYKMKNYWSATRINKVSDNTKDEETKSPDCENCPDRDACEALDRTLNKMGPFGAYIKDMVSAGKMKLVSINAPKDNNSSDDEESEEQDCDDIMSFIAAHTQMIHEHLDEFGFNERQLSEIEGIVHKEAEAMMSALRPYSSWRPYRASTEFAQVPAKLGKIKPYMTKKKVKKIIRKELEKLLKSKKFRKAAKDATRIKIREIASSVVRDAFVDGDTLSDVGFDPTDVEERIDTLERVVDGIETALNLKKDPNKGLYAFSTEGHRPDITEGDTEE